MGGCGRSTIVARPSGSWYDCLGAVVWTVVRLLYDCRTTVARPSGSWYDRQGVVSWVVERLSHDRLDRGTTVWVRSFGPWYDCRTTVARLSYDCRKTVWIVVLSVAAAVMSIVTIGGNLIVVLSFALERSIRQPSNYFIASLAVSDFLIGTVSMPSCRRCQPTIAKVHCSRGSLQPKSVIAKVTVSVSVRVIHSSIFVY